MILSQGTIDKQTATFREILRKVAVRFLLL